MPCAVAPISSSLVFTPSPRKLSQIYCNSTASPRSPSVSSPSWLGIKHVRNPFSGGEDVDVGPSKSTPLIKRKRPVKIDIPVMNLGFDDDRTISDFDKTSEVEVEGVGYSVYCKRGKRRRHMEDRYAAVLGSEDDSKEAFFGVFDGHGGAGAAEFAANNLEKNIMSEVSKRTEKGIEEAVKQGYLTTDSNFLSNNTRGGTCCVTALIHKGDLVVSNAGDCRAVICRGGVAEALTVDHRPSMADERERIENLGGYVDCSSHGVWRVHGSLAVSRAIGDSHLKKWVIAEPETKVFKIEPECEFLILASDGMWDKVGNQEAVDFVRSSLSVGVEEPRLLSACKKLVDLAVTRGSVDDTSVMVIELTQFIQ